MLFCFIQFSFFLFFCFFLNENSFLETLSNGLITVPPDTFSKNDSCPTERGMLLGIGLRLIITSFQITRCSTAAVNFQSQIAALHRNHCRTFLKPSTAQFSDLFLTRQFDRMKSARIGSLFKVSNLNSFISSYCLNNLFQLIHAKFASTAPTSSILLELTSTFLFRLCRLAFLSCGTLLASSDVLYSSFSTALVSENANVFSVKNCFFIIKACQVNVFLQIFVDLYVGI